MTDFKNYLEKGKVRKIKPDIPRIESIIIEAKKRKKFLDLMKNNIELNDDTANYFIENIYDTLIELIRAKMFLGGYKAIGHGSHEIEISYMKELGFSGNDSIFMNNMRNYRNGIKYYGKSFDSDYVKIALDFLEKVYLKLLKIIGK